MKKYLKPLCIFGIIWSFWHIFLEAYYLSHSDNILLNLRRIIMCISLGVMYIFLFEIVFPEKKGLKCKLLKRVRRRYSQEHDIWGHKIKKYIFWDRQANRFKYFFECEEDVASILAVSCLTVDELNKILKKKKKFWGSRIKK